MADELAACAPPTYQLACPVCCAWLVEWTPSPGGSVRARCDNKTCRHHVRFTYDAEQCLKVALLPRDLFQRALTWFLFLPLPLRPDATQIVRLDGKRYRVSLVALD